MRFLLVLSALLFVTQSQAGLLYTFSELTTKDLEQMNKIVQSKVKESRKSRGDKVIPLKEGFQAVYSRPNPDGLIEKIVGPLKAELDDHDAWEKSLKDLVKEAISALQNPKSFKATSQVTYLIFLDNVILELLQPGMPNEFEKLLLVSIRDAKLKISREAEKERVLRMMKQSPSPSVTAERILSLKPAATPASSY